MFTMKIVDSDAFLDMPATTQCLYFHLNMRADDDGFIGNPKRIMKITGASEDDLRLLIAKRFVLTFEDGVIVIKHWRMHNTLSRDRYTETSYIDEKRMLLLKENGSYSLASGNVIDDTKLIERSNRQTHNRRNKDATKTHSGKGLGIDIGKDIDKDIDIDKEKDNKLIVSKDTICQTDVRRVIEEWKKLQEVGINPIRDIKPSSKRYQLLKGRIREYGIDEVLNAINNVRNSDFLRGENNRGWMITFDWFVKPNNFTKVLEGNYNVIKGGDIKHGTGRTAQAHVKPLIPFDQCGGSEISDTPFAD
nr:MAG TPA: replisome organizer [Caudoviricetes sp.]